MVWVVLLRLAVGDQEDVLDHVLSEADFLAERTETPLIVQLMVLAVEGGILGVGGDLRKRQHFIAIQAIL